MTKGRSLLDGEEEPVIVVNGDGRSPIFLVCEHAGRKIPKCLGTLGLEPDALERHIAWDIGAEAVARDVSGRLDAPLVLQRYSRLVYDCNRPPESPGAMPAVSETTPIPGNEALSAEDREARTAALYRPFHATVARLLDQRLARGLETVFVTIHSFTPVYKGTRRLLDLGILHDRDSRFADLLLKLLEQARGLIVRRNEPYGPADGVTHTLILHAIARGLRNAMLEIRNDLISDAPGQKLWAERLSELFANATGAGAGLSHGAIARA